jgi:hypothetical protein
MSALHRIKSIYYDAGLVSSAFPGMETVANLRCGKWYCSDQNVKTCYFKSTDGHNGKWDFNTRRLNIPLLELVLSGKPVVIVDATANHRKVYPDALSKTIPIWIHIINRLIHKMGFADEIEPIKLPRFINETEKTNLMVVLDAKSSEWLSELENVLDEATLSRIHQQVETKGKKQLVPVFVSSMDLFDQCEYNRIIQQGNIPIMCFSVGNSDSICIENQFDRSFKYILGAGDDEEMWSMGLTPELFWENPNKFLNSANDIELAEMIKISLREHKQMCKSLHFMDNRVSILKREDSEKNEVSIKITTPNANFYKNIGEFDLTSKYGIEYLFPKINETIQKLICFKIQKIDLICNDFKVSLALLVSMIVRFGNLLFPCDLELSQNGAISKDYIRKIISYVYQFSGECQLPRCFCQQLNRFYISS